VTLIDDWIGHNIPEAVLNDAASWMALLDAERCNDADRLAFARWLDEDTSHRWAFEELSEVWARLHTLADVRPLLDDARVTRLPSRPTEAVAMPAPPVRSDWTALVASLLVVLGAAIHVLAMTPTQSFETRPGEITKILLQDGSRVELNVQSQMHAVLDAETREVELVSGDAVFHVQEASSPFIVKTEHGSVTVTGTSFAVSTTAAELRVLALEGAVSVTTSAPAQPLTEFDGEPGVTRSGASLAVAAGEQLEINAGGQYLRRLAADAIQRDLSWRHGYVEFVDQPLVHVVAEMRRYLGLNIHIADVELGKKRISDRYAIDDAADFLEKLRLDDDIAVDVSEPRWIILRPQIALANI
jgi:transmembrane sensor